MNTDLTTRMDKVAIQMNDGFSTLMDLMANLPSQLQSSNVQCVNNSAITTQTNHIGHQDNSLPIETSPQRKDRQYNHVTNQEPTGEIQNCIKRSFVPSDSITSTSPQRDSHSATQSPSASPKKKKQYRPLTNTDDIEDSEYRLNSVNNDSLDASLHRSRYNSSETDTNISSYRSLFRLFDRLDPSESSKDSNNEDNDL